MIYLCYCYRSYDDLSSSLRPKTRLKCYKIFPMHLNRKQLLLALIMAVAIFYRYFQLDTLPGEIFGDISQKLIHIDSILHGDFQIVYGYDVRQGMLFYLTAPFAIIFGNTYLTLKLVVAAIGVITVFAMYRLGTIAVNEETGLVVATITAVSRWHVTFSRIGFRAILTPLFVVLTIYYLIKAYRQQKWSDFILLGILLGLGVYTYYAFIFMILSLALILLIISIRDLPFVMSHYKKIVVAFGMMILVITPMAIDYVQSPSKYYSHAGPMLFKEGRLPNNTAQLFFTNFKNQMLMFNVRGDAVFRVNPVREPQLDVISGVFFLIGVLYWLVRKNKAPAFFLFVPFFVLQLPSILVLNFPDDIPSATRAIGVIPITYLFVASGLVWISRLLHKKRVQIGYIAILLAVIAGLNFYGYFVTYADGLPYRNAGTGTVIGRQIDHFSKNTFVVIMGCCWGPWGEPDKDDIRFATAIRSRKINFVEKDEFKCEEIKSKKEYALFLPPMDKTELNKYISCLKKPTIKEQKTKYGEVIYVSVTGKN